MPRPGARPYECVRRAWHSERHCPVRGSIIQELFRVACEVHGEGTRKNREWEEKLPFVVVRVEEILYSRANSEVEYVDLKTLPDRANDAIDIIIRRDKTLETGNLLEPCIEAALNLGCVPMRASRSQRDTFSRTNYLSSISNPSPNACIGFPIPNPVPPRLGRVYPTCHLTRPNGMHGHEAREEAYDFLNVGRVGEAPNGLPETGGGSHGNASELCDSDAGRGSDLSLRLGCPSEHLWSGWLREVEEVGSNSTCSGSEGYDLNCSPTPRSLSTPPLKRRCVRMEAK